MDIPAPILAREYAVPLLSAVLVGSGQGKFWVLLNIEDEIFGRLSQARAALVGKFGWFLHQTSSEFIDDIRCRGLEPRYKEGRPRFASPSYGNASNILCLEPYLLGVRPRGLSSHPSPDLWLAVRCADLPKRIGLDWSINSGHVLAVAQFQRDLQPNKSAEEIFVDMVVQYGSVVTYEIVKPEYLREKSGCGDDPADWPLLISRGRK